jgi:hypothetical protein
MAVQTGAGIPAAVFWGGIIDCDEKAVFLPELHIGSKVGVEGGITVGMKGDKIPVQPDFSIHVGSVNFDKNPLTFPIGGNVQILGIGTNSPGIKPAGSPIGGVS